ncbi:MAG: riboflavin synthase [Myxococcales bacterium]|nr:riboflavin synthase [Myxococcales bacterium]MCB9524138.1 riboflavin synthase [Myxococcales bacterium]
MFTGLIEATGTLRRVDPLPKGVTLTLGAPRALVAELALGDSVACDGACLTVTRFSDDWFTVDASAETMARTALGERRPGHRVHLERALRLGDRLGGHIVAGHVDGTGRLVRKAPLGEAVQLEFSAPPEVARYLVDKGSVAIDGVSLTVNTVDDAAGTFSVVLIPHTQGVVTLADRPVGSRVNLEADVIGKYVERLLTHRGGAGAHKAPLDLETLARAGFMSR